MDYKKFLGAASTALMIIIVIMLVLVPGASAQVKYKTLHAFTTGVGEGPYLSPLIFDTPGNLYGTTMGVRQNPCGNKCGTVFKLAPNLDGTWTETVLYRFTGGADGSNPIGALTFGGDGSLYGTTETGGAVSCFGAGCGTVFKLTPNPDGSWVETVLRTFTGYEGGIFPTGGLVFDKSGNLYGTTANGGSGGRCVYFCGAVFKLAPNPDGTWTYTILYNFQGRYDGGSPVGGLIIDNDSNLYGATGVSCGSICVYGTIFKLSADSDGTWTHTTIYGFGKSGRSPNGELIFDSTGYLYGTTSNGGRYGEGIVFRLTPASQGHWKYAMLHQFVGSKGGGWPLAGLILDKTGSLYGTTYEGGASGYGVAFKLSRTPTGGWDYQILHVFAGAPGAYPTGSMTFDATGNLYGTTAGDGTKTFGSVFELTP